MNCKNHPEGAADKRCTGCAEPFCRNCLVELRGLKYCAECKHMAFQGSSPRLPDEAMIASEQASESLKYALVSLVCLGMVFGPLAVARGMEARKAILADPALEGWGKANAGVAIGAVGFFFWLLGFVGKFAA